eukprot:Opistho-1_new@6609
MPAPADLLCQSRQARSCCSIRCGRRCRRSATCALIGQESQGVDHHDERRSLMEQHRRADVQAQNGGGDQHRDHAQTDEQVLLDDPARAARQTDGKGQLRKVVRHQGHVCGLQRHVRTRCAHSDAHRRIGHRWCVVDAIPHHGHLAVFLAECLDRLDLLLRHQIPARFGQSDGLGHGIGHLLVVAGNHDQALDSQRSQLSHHILGHRSRRVHHRDHSQEALAFADHHRRAPARDQLVIGLFDFDRQRRTGQFREQHRFADVDILAIDLRLHAAPCDALDLAGYGRLHAIAKALTGACNDGGCERVIAVLFNGQCHRQQLILGRARSCRHLGQLRLALGQGARLVESDRRQRAQVLQRTTALDQDATAPGSCHTAQHGAGHRDGEGAGAGRDQHGHRPVEAR